MTDPITLADPHHGWNVIAVGGTMNPDTVIDGPDVVPPAEWAQWTDATCDTCEGCGCDQDWCQDCGNEYEEPCARHADHLPEQVCDDGCCPDCVDGQPKVEVQTVKYSPHQYTEKSARARLARRREHGEALVMMEHEGHWYTGSFVRWGWAHSFQAVPIEWDQLDADHLYVTPDGYLFGPGSPDRKAESRLTMPPDARPGGWVLAATLEGER